MASPRNTYIAHMTNAANNGTPCVPGDGAGSVLARVTAAKNIASIYNPTIITLNDVTSLVVGQLVISIDGFWGTIAEINPSGAPANSIRVHKWRHRQRKESSPAAATSALNIFPAGSVLANMDSGARIERLIVTQSITGVSANYLLDHRMATATPLLPYASVVGQIGSEELGIDIAAPFAMQVATHANCNLSVVFTVN